MNMMKRVLAVVFVLALLAVLPVAAQAAEVGTMADLKNAIESGTDETITLTADFEFDGVINVGRKVTVTGAKTLTRADSYTGTLFNVKPGGELTLDGGLTIDGNNNWTLDSDAYDAALANFTRSNYADFVSSESGAPSASAYMMTVSGTVDSNGDVTNPGTLNLKNVNIKNHYSSSDKGIVSASSGAVVNLDGAQITHCAANGSGVVVNASTGKWDYTLEDIVINMYDGTMIDSNFVGGNHGIFKVYMGTVFNMHGGTIQNTKGVNANGNSVGVYWAIFNMYGGKISSNSSLYGANNGRCAPIYLHNASQFTMTGGEISGNKGGSRSGLDAPYTDDPENEYSATATITGGKIINNSSYYADHGQEGYLPNITAGNDMTITGGTFSQDVAEFISEGSNLVSHDNGDGTWTVMEVYTITYELDGGEATGNPATYIEGDAVTLKNPTRKGYTFLGWTGANGNVPQKDLKVTMTGDLVFTANWEKIPEPTATPEPAATPIPATDDLPKTGDNSQLMLFMALMAVSASCLLLLRRRRASR